MSSGQKGLSTIKNFFQLSIHFIEYNARDFQRLFFLSFFLLSTETPCVYVCIYVCMRICVCMCQSRILKNKSCGGSFSVSVFLNHKINTFDYGSQMEQCVSSSSWSIKLTGTRIHRHGSPTLFLFSRDRIHRTDRRLLRRRPLPILLRACVAALLASAQHLTRLPADLLLLARLRHLVQLGHRLLYSVLQLHVQFTTSRKRNGANEKIVGLVVKNESVRAYEPNNKFQIEQTAKPRYV